VDAENVGLALHTSFFQMMHGFAENARIVVGQGTGILNTLQQFIYSIHH
jgi:hypothetical protein